MKHKLWVTILIVAVFVLGGLQDALAGTWTPVSPIPAPLAGGLVRCADDPDSFYMVGGIRAFIITSNKLYRYDIATDNWERLANIPKATRTAGTTCYEGKIYVAGGWANKILDSMFIYDIASDTWSKGPKLPEPTWGAGLGAWEGKLYLVGGNRGADNYAADGQVDVYHILSRKWTASGAADMPYPSGFYGFAQAGSYLYVAGGFTDQFPANGNHTQRYDMDTDTWTAGPEFTSARAYGTMAVTDSHLYFGGGDLSGETIADLTDLVEMLDLSVWPGGAWADAGFTLPAPNLYTAMTCSETLGGEIWDVGGVNTGVVPWELYDEVYYLPIEEGCS